MQQNLLHFLLVKFSLAQPTLILCAVLHYSVMFSGITDQYADGKAAKIWQLYIGDKSQRTVHYKNFLVDLLKAKGCRRVIDVACGNG